MTARGSALRQGLFGRLRRLPAGERLMPVFDPSVPSVILSAGLVALVLIAAMAFFDAVSIPWQRQLPRGFILFFQGITDLGQSGWELFPCGILLLVLAVGDWRREARLTRLMWLEVGRLAAFVFAVVAVSGLTTDVIKAIVGRARPVQFDQLGPFAFEPFSFGYQFASFPSGHATTLGAAAVAFGLIAPKWRLHIFLTAIVIAASRVVVGAHYPSDVAAGFLFGGLCAYAIAARFAADGFGFSRSSDDSIRARTAVFRRVTSRRSGLVHALAGPYRALARRVLPLSD